MTAAQETMVTKMVVVPAYLNLGPLTGGSCQSKNGTNAKVWLTWCWEERVNVGHMWSQGDSPEEVKDQAVE